MLFALFPLTCSLKTLSLLFCAPSLPHQPRPHRHSFGLLQKPTTTQDMRFSAVVAGAFMAASAVSASPVAPTLKHQLVAGHVVTNKNFTYQMVNYNEIKTFDNKVDNGEYPFPVTYKVNEGFKCIFYT
jgi:hypothetical protein